MEYIKITYDNGVEWFAKWNSELKRYESEAIRVLSDESGSRNELVIDQVEHSTFKELQQESQGKAEGISRAEYWIYIHKLILQRKQNEIKEMRAELDGLISEEKEYANYIAELEQGIFNK